MKRTRSVFASLVLVSLLVSCSGSDDDGGGERISLTPADEAPARSGSAGDATADDYADALASSLAADVLFDAESAACTAPRWIEAIGVDALANAGISPDLLAAQEEMSAIRELGLPMATTGPMVEAMVDCGADPLASALDGSSGVGMDDATVACIRASMPSQVMEAAIAASLTGSVEDPGAAAAMGAYRSILVDCGVPN